MKINQAKFGALALITTLFSLQAYAQCSNASLNGTYFSSFGGTILVGTTNSSHQDLGKVIADGNGNLSGTTTASVAGNIVTQSATGSYTVKANCSGTGTISNASNSFSFTLQIVNGGSLVLASVTSSTLGQIGEGRLYRAANATGAACGTGTVAGTYGVLLSGGTYAAAVRTGYDAVNQTTFDGNGGVTIAGEVTSGISNGITWNGTGTYSFSPDCSGTAQVSSPVGTVNYSLARVEGGAVLFLETDPSTTISGTGTAQNVEQIVPQIAFGTGWYSALYFSNTTALSQTFVVTFTGDDGTPMTIPGVGATKRVTLAPQATALIEAPNSGVLTQGYATFSLPSGVTGYLVVRQTVAGVADQEALVGFKNANATATSFTWDDTNYTTAIALANPSTVSATVTVTAWSTSGTLIGTGTLTLAPGKKTATALRGIAGLGAVAGQRGTALVSVPSGNVAVLGLRFDGLAFTSIPTTQQQ